MLKRNYSFFILTILGSLIFAIIFSPQQGLSQEEISEKIKKQCEGRYDNFKKLDEENFIKKYSDTTISNICLNLFENDVTWTFKGNEKIDKHYDKLDQLSGKINPLIKSYENQNLEIKKISSTKIGFQNYAVKFRICADNKPISEPKFFVVTDNEYYLEMGNREIKENSCNFVMSYTSIKDPEKVSLFPFDGNYIPSKYLKVKSIY